MVNIILDMYLEYGLTTRPRANTIIDTVTYLVDGTVQEKKKKRKKGKEEKEGKGGTLGTSIKL